MSNPLYVYIAGPISSDPLGGARYAVRTAAIVESLGMVPYVPHLGVLWEMISPMSYEKWMALGLAWLAKCDAVLRLPGESKGADREEEEARRMGIPVFRDIAELERYSMGLERFFARKAKGETGTR